LDGLEGIDGILGQASCGIGDDVFIGAGTGEPDGDVALSGDHDGGVVVKSGVGEVGIVDAGLLTYGEWGGQGDFDPFAGGAVGEEAGAAGIDSHVAAGPEALVSDDGAKDAEISDGDTGEAVEGGGIDGVGHGQTVHGDCGWVEGRGCVAPMDAAAIDAAFSGGWGSEGRGGDEPGGIGRADRVEVMGGLGGGVHVGDTGEVTGDDRFTIEQGGEGNGGDGGR